MEFLGDKRLDSTAVIPEPIEYTEGTFAPIEVANGSTEQIDMASPKGPLAGCVNSFFTAPKSGVYTITAFFGAIEPTATTDSMFFILYGTQTETKIVASSIATGDMSANVSATVRMPKGSLIQFGINNKGSVARTYNNPGNNNMQAPSWNISLIQTNVHPVGSGVDPYYFTQAELDALESPVGSGVYPTLEPGRQIIITDTPAPMETTPSDFANYTYSKGEINSKIMGSSEYNNVGSPEKGTYYTNIPILTNTTESSDEICVFLLQVDSASNPETKKGFVGRLTASRGSDTKNNSDGIVEILAMKSQDVSFDVTRTLFGSFNAKPVLYRKMSGSEEQFWLGFIYYSTTGSTSISFEGRVIGGEIDNPASIRYAIAAANGITILQDIPYVYNHISSNEWRRVDKTLINDKYVWTKRFYGNITAGVNAVSDITLCTITGKNLSQIYKVYGEWYIDAYSQFRIPTYYVNSSGTFQASIGRDANTITFSTQSGLNRTSALYDFVLEVTTTDNKAPTF